MIQNSCVEVLRAIVIIDILLYSSCVDLCLKAAYHTAHVIIVCFHLKTARIQTLQLLRIVQRAPWELVQKLFDLFQEQLC